MAYGTMSIGNAGFTKKFISALFLLMHPVGTPYASENPTSPAELYGGTWERIEDCTIWGASDTHPAGTTVEAGLPNITGGFGGTQVDDIGPATGAIYTVTNYDVLQEGIGYSKMSLRFDASRSNPIYGASDTVQPPAYCLYIWRRVA